jgi:hypothetical protein
MRYDTGIHTEYTCMYAISCMMCRYHHNVMHAVSFTCRVWYSTGKHRQRHRGCGTLILLVVRALLRLHLRFSIIRSHPYFLRDHGATNIKLPHRSHVFFVVCVLDHCTVLQSKASQFLQTFGDGNPGCDQNTQRIIARTKKSYMKPVQFQEIPVSAFASLRSNHRYLCDLFLRGGRWSRPNSSSPSLFPKKASTSAVLHHSAEQNLVTMNSMRTSLSTGGSLCNSSAGGSRRDEGSPFTYMVFHHKYQPISNISGHWDFLSLPALNLVSRCWTAPPTLLWQAFMKFFIISYHMHEKRTVTFHVRHDGLNTSYKEFIVVDKIVLKAIQAHHPHVLFNALKNPAMIYTWRKYDMLQEHKEFRTTASKISRCQVIDRCPGSCFSRADSCNNLRDSHEFNISMHLIMIHITSTHIISPTKPYGEV